MFRTALLSTKRMPNTRLAVHYPPLQMELSHRSNSALESEAVVEKARVSHPQANTRTLAPVSGDHCLSSCYGQCGHP